MGDTCRLADQLRTGYIADSAHKHVKYGVAAPVVGILCLMGAWMLSAKDWASPPDLPLGASRCCAHP